MSLRQTAVAGAKWTGAATAVTMGLQYVRLAILAQLLEPGDFGLMAMITFVVGFAERFADMGVSNAIIHRQSATREELSTLYWLNVLMGAGIFAIVWAISPFVADFYREPRLTGLIVWSALSFLLVPFGQQFQMLLQKELKFARIAKVEVAAATVGTIVGVTSAVAGQGVFALIWGQLAIGGTKALLLAAIGWTTWRPHFHFSFKDLRGFLSFGLYQMGERSVNYFMNNVDYLVIGRFLGKDILGFYTLAYNLVIVPLVRINPIIVRVAFPVFAMRQSDDTKLRRGYLEMMHILSLMILPALIGIAVTAPVAVPTIFGPTWLPAVPLVQILSILGVFRALYNPVGSILLAKGRADIGFVVSLFIAVINTVVFWLLVDYGVRAVAWSYVGLSSLIFVTTQVILKRVIGVGWIIYGKTLVRPLIMSVLMGACVFGAWCLLKGAALPQVALLILLVGLGVVVYGLLALALEGAMVREVWRLAWQRKSGSEA